MTYVLTNTVTKKVEQEIPDYAKFFYLPNGDHVSPPVDGWVSDDGQYLLTYVPPPPPPDTPEVDPQ